MLGAKQGANVLNRFRQQRCEVEGELNRISDSACEHVSDGACELESGGVAWVRGEGGE